MRTEVVGRLVLPDRILAGRITIAEGRIAAIDPDPGGDAGPWIAPGFIDLHVHGWGGHDAMDGAEALDGMARALLARGVTTFLPTAVSAPLDELRRFAATVRDWAEHAPGDGARRRVSTSRVRSSPPRAPGRTRPSSCGSPRTSTRGILSRCWMGCGS